MPTPVHSEMFRHGGRGPVLLRVHWNAWGTRILAIDYYNLDDDLQKHVVFVRPQVVMITPDEVIGQYASERANAGGSAAAMFDLGRSAWLNSFAPYHLERCSHLQLYFYDDLFDVIAEGVECHTGGFVPSHGTST